MSKTVFLLLAWALFFVGCSAPDSLQPPELYSSDTHFGSAIELSGLAYPRATVKLYSGESLVGYVKADSKGEFSFALDGNELGEGFFNFNLVQSYKDVLSEHGDSFEVSVDLTPPEKNIVFDGDVDTYTNSDSLVFSGSAGNFGDFLFINNHVYSIDESGRFYAEYPLVSGNNKLEFSLEDAAGNNTGNFLSYVITKDVVAPVFSSFSTSCQYTYDSNGNWVTLSDVGTQERVCVSSGQFYGPWEGYASAPLTGWVKGEVASVKVDGKSLSWRDDGYVNQRVSLYMRQGSNTFDVEVIDKAGNVSYGSLGISWGDANDTNDSSDLEDMIYDLESRIEDLE